MNRYEETRSAVRREMIRIVFVSMWQGNRTTLSSMGGLRPKGASADQYPSRSTGDDKGQTPSKCKANCCTLGREFAQRRTGMICQIAASHRL